MLSLSEIYFKDLNAEKESLLRINLSVKDELQIKSDINFLWYYNQTFAIYQLNQGNITACKQHFYTCGRIDEYLTKKFNSRRLDAGVANITYALLSDSKPLMQRYAMLSHPWYSSTIKSGSLTHAIQNIVKEDWEGLMEDIKTYERIVTTKKGSINIPDLTFFKGILNKDVTSIKTAVLQLLKDHKKRNRLMDITKDYFSIPTLTYLKLAWLRGLEIVIDHPLLRNFYLTNPLINMKKNTNFLKN